MNRKSVKINIDLPSTAYKISFGDGFLVGIGDEIATLTNQRRPKIAIISNKKIFGLYGGLVCKSLLGKGFEVTSFLIGDGEQFKSLRTFEKTLEFLSLSKFSRTDLIVALGGGVVGDLAGFAASVYLRGIDFIQIPTSLLSMIDSSVGGKTAVNTKFGKNLIGSFYQPKAVFIDVSTLKTLPDRELTAGLCEAVKQGAISGKKLFDQTAKVIEKIDVSSRSWQKGSDFSEFILPLIVKHVEFKAKIVRGDERESVSRKSARSRKILNFGHTFAHAIEKVTGYTYLKHGEAVGWGIIFAAELSKKLGLLDEIQVNLLNDVVHRTGVLPSISHIEPSKALEAFNNDKKVVNDSLQWVLLERIGKPRIVSQKIIPQKVLIKTLEKVIRR
ncbi:MAG: 3-dehydroquinate synthase [Blastocatellia bacterium]